MKKILAITPVVFGIFIITYLVTNYLSSPGQTTDPYKARGTEQNQEDHTTIEHENVVYETDWLLLNSTDNLSLINNLDKKLVSIKAASDYNCEYLISAGFYTEDDKPVGYLKTDTDVVRDITINKLFNSVLSVNIFETPRITRDLPRDKIRIGVQTGPLLIENSSSLQFDSSDDPARRVVAGVTGENRLVLIVIYTPNSSILGPVLSDLPEILEVWEDKSGIILADATNLDGGSASAFITEETKLVESSKVGSFFCQKSI